MPEARSSRILIAVGAIIAVIAFGLASALAAFALFGTPASAPSGMVVVAATDILARATINDTDLQLAKVAPVPPGSFGTINAVIGKVARVSIPKGLPISSTLIGINNDQLGPGSTSLLPIPQGYVAVTIPSSEEMAVGGYAQRGDRIIIMATLQTSIFGATRAIPVVRTVFRDVLISGVGTPSGVLLPAQTVTSAVPTSLTVQVTQCDSEYLFWLRQVAQLKYVLESYKDAGVGSPTGPDPNCPTITSGTGVGSAEVDARWHFSAG